MHGEPFRLILRVQGAAAHHVASAIHEDIARQSAPQQVKDIRRAVVAVNARAAQFGDLRSQRFVRSEVKLLLAVIAEVFPGDIAQDWLVRWRDNPKALERELALTPL